MTYRGDYDPTGFDPNDPTGWPGWTGAGTTYVAGDWWYLTAPATIPEQAGGIIPATAVDVGDRLYPIGFGRLMGDGTMGSGVMGGPLGSPWQPATGATILWRPWSAMLDAPWDRPAPPYAGCPLDEDRFPGWRIVLELLYADDATARRMGDDLLGDGVMGSGAGRSWEAWNDATTKVYGFRVRRGGVDGSPVVPVDELDVALFDLDADRFSFTVPSTWAQPSVGNLARLSLLDPYGGAVPVFVGRIEQVLDDHDAPPRRLEMQAFGLAMDLVTVLARWSRPAETSLERVAAVLTAADWDWGEPQQIDRPDLDQTAHASSVEPIQTAAARTLLDIYALSGRMSADFARDGRPRFRSWPLRPVGPPLLIADCPVAGDGFLPAEVTRFVGDLAETLNVVEVDRGDADGAGGFAHLEDPPSIARVGRRSQALGFPLTGLTATDATLAALAADTLDRFARIVDRVVALEVDTHRHPDWFEVLADLDTGRPVVVERRAFPAHPLRYDCVLVGLEHRIAPRRWRATLFLSTITRTI